MSHLVSLIITVLLFSPSCAGNADTRTTAKPEPQLLVENILSEIQRALINVQNEAGKGEVPPLSSVTLTLSTQFIAEGGAKLSLYIITLGGGISKESAQTLTLKLTPPEPGAKAPVSAAGFAEGLSTAIVSAGRAVRTAQKEKPPLTLEELVASIKFVVKKEGEGGIKFTITPVTAELGGDLKSVETQEITVTFKTTDKKVQK